MSYEDVATDEDWADPKFDYLQAYIGTILSPDFRGCGGHEWAIEEAQRWRDQRPRLIAEIRRSIGNPKWDPRGASVTSINTKLDQDER